MGAPYRCGTSARRQAVAASTATIGSLQVNGIDFREVIDREATDEALRQRILHLHFLKPGGVADLGPANIRIEGGARVTSISVLSVAPLGGSARALVLTLDRYGDFSRYALRLVADDGSGAPVPFDPPLAEVAFTFKTDCPTGFDCAVSDVCPPDVPPAPKVDALAKDYESFRGLMLDRMAQTMPAWTERNPADLGVTLVELLADAADRLSYRQDAAATEAYLGTARKRVSVARHARLTGYRLHEGTNARTVVAFEVAADVAASDPDGTPLPVVPRGTRLLAATRRPTVLPTDQALTVLAETAAVFETLDDVLELRTARTALGFHTWGERDCCLARGAVRAFLARPDPTLVLREGDLLVLEEGPRANGGPADPTRRHPVRLAADAVVMHDAVEDVDVLEVRWHGGDALPFPLRLDGAVVRANAVLADHGRTFETEGAVLDPPSPPARGPWRPALPEDLGLVHATAHDTTSMQTRPVADALRQDPHTSLPALRLAVAGETWLPTLDLLAADPFAAAFVVETEPGERPRLRFGDGVFGRRPAGMFAVMTWRRGGGPAGNVGAESLRHLLLPEAELQAAYVAGWQAGRFAFADAAAAAAAASFVLDDLTERVTGLRNPLPATGGVAPQSTLEAKLHAPQAFRVQARAVTTDDYARAAERHTEVQRAVARRRWMGSWHVLFLTVDRAERRPVDAAFAAELRGFLEPLRLAGHDLQVIPPRFVPLDVALWVCVAPGFVAADVERALRQRLTSGRRPDGSLGYFHPDRFSFGEDVALSPLLAEMMAVEGVRWVGVCRPGGGGEDGWFRKLREPVTDYADAGVIPIGDLEVAVLDDDPNRPEDGRLRLFVEGGS
jgi:hypothetical protein